MAALGRLLQIIGWLWVLVGFVGPRAGLDDLGLGSLGVFPGLVMIFIARSLRSRARAEEEQASGEARPQPRSARTETGAERRQAPTPPPPARREPTPPPAERTPQPKPQPEPRVETEPPADQNDLLERIALAGRSEEEERATATLNKELESLQRVDEERKPMSSAEMIAQARRRWDRPGR